MKRPTIDRPSPADVPPEETARVVANGVAQLDLDRAAAYAGLGTLRIGKAASFHREEKLLARKYGDKHPRVAAVSTRRAANAVFQRDLAVAHQLAATPAPAVDAETYVLHGFVRDCQSRPLPRLTVALYDANGAWISALSYGCTDETGRFLLRGARAQKPDWAGQPATICVYDAEKKLVHREAEPVRPAPGRIDYRAIVICDDGVCTPPPDAPDEPPPAPVTVPNVIGLLESAAQAEIRKAGLAVESSTRESTAENAGRVIEQTPNAGAKAAPGSVVAIVIGIPPSKVAVPDVTGVTLRDARAILAKAEFAVGKVEPAGAPLQGKVVQQSPAAGALAERGSAVDLVVQLPAEKVAVPNVVGMTLRDARVILAKAEFAVGKVEPAGAPLQGKVVQQSPAAGVLAERGSAVDLVVERAAEKVAVPKVVKLALGEAKKAIADSGLAVGTIKPPGAPDTSIVAEQSPEPEKMVERGAPVHLATEETSGKVTVPEVTGMKLGEARQVLKDARLKHGSIKPSTASDEHVVASQSPAARTQVDEGTPVDLEVKTQSNRPAKRKPGAKKKPGKSSKEREP